MNDDGDKVPAWTAEDETNLARRVINLGHSGDVNHDHPPLAWAGPLTWVLEDRMGARFEVDVEPLTDPHYRVGDRLEIAGEPHTLVGKRGRMVVAS